jgi:hypothetical protein
MEPESILDEPEGESEERRALRLLFGGRMLRRRRMRRLLLAHLLRQGDDIEDDEMEETRARNAKHSACCSVVERCAAVSYAAWLWRIFSASAPPESICSIARL